MEKQPSGIDLSRLIQTNDLDEILCPICNMILWDPVGCSECQNCFCNECIDHWLEKSKKKLCPNRCYYVKKKAPPILFKFLSKLTLKCKNFENGCKEEINYDLLTIHEKECAFSLEQCKGCKTKLIRKDLSDHEKDCEMITIVCDICGKCLMRKEMKNHEIMKCLQEKIKKNEIEFKKEISLRDATILKIQEDLNKEISNREKSHEKHRQELKALNEKLENFLHFYSEHIIKDKFQYIKQNYVIKEVTLDQYVPWAIGGYMFDIEAKKPIIITQIGFMSRGTSNFKVGLYYRYGSFRGKEENPNEWKLLYDDSLSFTKGEIIMIPVELDLEVRDNTFIAFYVSCNESVDENGEIIGTENHSIPYKDFDELTIYNGSFHIRTGKRFKLWGAGYIRNVGFLGKIKYKC